MLLSCYYRSLNGRGERHLWPPLHRCDGLDNLGPVKRPRSPGVTVSIIWVQSSVPDLSPISPDLSPRSLGDDCGGHGRTGQLKYGCMEKKLTALIFFVAATAGCVTADKVESRLKTWQGVDADQLAASWGAPFGSYAKKDGSRILSYASNNVFTSGIDGYQQTHSQACQIDVVVNKDNAIADMNWRGSVDQCGSMIRPYTGAPSEIQPADPAPTTP